MAHENAERHEDDGGHHVVPLKVYFAVFGALLVLTAVTVQVSYVDLGRLNVLVALTIAVTKATLVALFFMHLRYGPKLNMVVASASIVWLLLMFAFTMGDFLTRTPISTNAF